MRKIDKIILHCSATQEGKNFKANDIDTWHKNQGYKKIGYHYVIDIDGTLEQGRNETEIGAHAYGYNSNSIGICYIGGVDKNNKPKDTRTKEQKETLYNLIYNLLNKYNLNISNIKCHNQLSNKACPSFNIQIFIDEYIEWLNTKLK